MPKKSNSTSYAIIGLGRFGSALALELAKSGAELLVLDRDEEKVRELREVTENAFVVNGFDKKSLTATGVQNCDVAVVCIAEQMDVSILMTLNLVALGVPKVIAKASSAEHGEILEKLGAEVVFPERDMALRLAHRLDSARMLDYIQLSAKVNISKLIVPDALVGQTIQQANLNGRFSLTIIAIEHGTAVVDAILPNYVFSAGDILYLAGGDAGLTRFTDWAEKA